MPRVSSLIAVAQLSTQAFVPYGKADTELEWFFTMAECDIAPRSPFLASLMRALPKDSEENAMIDRVEARQAQRTLLRWIQALDDHDAGVLKAAYVARPWPLMLREALGRLTGVVVRLAAAEVGLPDDDRELDLLEQRTAIRLNEALASDASVVERLKRQASPLLKKAFTGYVRERGGTEKPSPRGVS